MGRAARRWSRRGSPGCAQLAAEHGRTLRFGIRLHVITRDRASDAWAETERFLDAIDPAVIAAAQAAMARSASVGQQRMVSLHGGTRDELVIAPEPVGRRSASCAAAPAPRSSAATTRSPTASRSTTQLGFDEFILSGHPHLEEAYWFGEGVMPVLRRRGLLAERPRRPGEADSVLGRHAVTNAR